MHFDVAFKPIKHTKFKIIFERFCTPIDSILDTQLPLLMFHDGIVGFLVVPFESLQKPQQNTVIVVEARRQISLSLVLHPLSEVVHVLGLPLPQLLTEEDQALVVA